MIIDNRLRVTRRRMCAAAAGAASAGMLAACARSGSAGAEPGTGGATKLAPATLRLWHIWGGARVPLMDRQVAGFMGEYPQIKTEHLVLTAAERRQKFLSAVAAGDPPEVAMINRSEVQEFVETGVILPIDERLKRDKLSADLFYPGEWESARYKGKTWCIPLPVGSAYQIVYYNPRLFADSGLDPNKPPATWQDMLNAGARLQRKDGDALLQSAGNWEVGDHAPFTHWLYTNGGQLLSPDARRVTFNSPEGVETLEFLKRYVEVALGSTAAVQAFYQRAGGADRAFYDEKQAMRLTGYWYFFYLKSEAPQVPYRWAKLPHGSRGKSQGSFNGGWSYGYLQGAKSQDAGWELIKWLCIGKGAFDFLKAQGMPSAYKPMNEDPKFSENVPHWGFIQDLLKTDVHIPENPVDDKLRMLLRTATNDVMAGKIGAKAALDDAAREGQRLLDEFWSQHKG